MSDTAGLTALVSDLVRRNVAVLVANSEAAHTAKRATRIIPIVFVTGADPVAGGLVASINRPGGNVTGVSFLDVPLAPKRLGVLNEFLSDRAAAPNWSCPPMWFEETRGGLHFLCTS